MGGKTGVAVANANWQGLLFPVVILLTCDLYTRYSNNSEERQQVRRFLAFGRRCTNAGLSNEHAALPWPTVSNMRSCCPLNYRQSINTVDPCELGRRSGAAEVRVCVCLFQDGV